MASGRDNNAAIFQQNMRNALANSNLPPGLKMLAEKAEKGFIPPHKTGRRVKLKGYHQRRRNG